MVSINHERITIILCSVLVIFWLTYIAAAQSSDSCTITSILAATRTATALSVSTYCPASDYPVYTTVYQTTLVAIGTTGLTSSAYTVTNVALGSASIDPNTCPPGFTTTVLKCAVCAGQPTVTITTPIANGNVATLISSTTVKNNIISASSTPGSGGIGSSTSSNGGNALLNGGNALPKGNSTSSNNIYGSLQIPTTIGNVFSSSQNLAQQSSTSVPAAISPRPSPFKSAGSSYFAGERKLLVLLGGILFNAL